MRSLLRTGTTFGAVPLAVGLALLMLSASVPAAAPSSWTKGQEKDLTGHTFEEEQWTAEVSFRNESGGNSSTWGVSYLNKYDAQAFLVNFKIHTNDKGRTSTVPYQLFGLHYRTPVGAEVFIGGILSFLMAFNDTSNGTGASSGPNGLPDPGQEPVYYIIPFGLSDVKGFEDMRPEVTVQPVTMVSPDHYRFEVSYKNLYAKVIDGNSGLGALLSALLPVYIARFSELTIRYDVSFDRAKGTVVAETFYTIGAVQQLWVWGVDTDPDAVLIDGWGLAAVHTVAVFTSRPYSWYRTGETHRLDTNIASPIDEIQLSEGAEAAALRIGTRGTYDRIDQLGGGDVVVNDEPALAGVFAARPLDHLLVAVQAPFSLDLFATFAYALSEDNQKQFKSPADLRTRAGARFIGQAFWYGVSFPHWQGDRIEHDPTYTASAALAGGADGDGKPTPRSPGFTGVLTLLALTLPVVVVLVRARRR